MENKKKLLIRLIILSLLLFGGSLIICVNLIDLQIINGDEYRAQTRRKLTGSTVEYASRGEILDRYGRPLVTNKTVFSIRIDKTYWNNEQQNDTILTLLNMIDENGGVVTDSLPISKTKPYIFTAKNDTREYKALLKYYEDKSWGENLTAPALVEKLMEEFEIDDKFSENDARRIISVRYEMIQRQFSSYNSFTFAKDINIELVAKIKEQNKLLPGVEISVDSVREYATQYAAHILGRVGPIYAEEWDTYKELGYAKNATVGKDGMEKVLEEYLKSTIGMKTFETDMNRTSENIVEEDAAKPGKNCVLTIDLALQEVMENSLATTLDSLPNALGGAAVVLDVNSGEVLAMASYPTYNLETFNKDYNTLSKNKLTPMINRAVNGVYAPGSTYKILTAISGLEEGVIDSTTKVLCTGVYSYYGYRPRCHKRSGHGIETVTTAIRDSCNIFFYETGKRLGAEAMEKYAHSFGLGEKTGIEIPESKGMVAGPTNTEALRDAGRQVNEWMGGNTLQAAIGQSDHQYTPLQLVSYIATVVNGGTRYKTHLLKSVKEYDYGSTYYEVKPEVLNKVEMSDTTYQLVMKGMNEVVNEGGTAARIFRDYPIQVGGKSGTAQVTGKIDYGVFVAFAPYNNPEIAVCVVGEQAESGSNVAPVVRDVFDQYFGNNNIEKVDLDYSIIR